MRKSGFFRFAKCFTKLAVLGIFLAAASASALASPVDVTYTVSGSSGAWILNFSVTNNVNSGQIVYFFGVLLPAQDILNSPGGSANCGLPCTTTWNPSLNGGGPNLTYNDLWINFSALPGGGFSFGSTLSGFDVGVNTVTAPTSVPWFAYSFDSTPGGTSPYTGGGNFSYTDTSYCLSLGYTSCSQLDLEDPGFAGVAFAVVAAPTPEPSSLLLLGTGLLGLGPLLRRRFARS